MAEDPLAFVNDIVNFITQNPLVLLFILGIVGLIYFVFTRSKIKKDEFVSIPLSHYIISDLGQVTGLRGLPVKNRHLRIGAMDIGLIKDISMIYHYTHEKEIIDPKKKDKILPIDPVEMYLFRIRDSGLLANIQDKIVWKIFPKQANYKYVLVEKEAIKVQHDFIIAEKTGFARFAGVFVFSGNAREHIIDLAWKVSFENQLENFVNFPKKQTYLEMRQARRVEYAEKLTELEKSKWEKPTRKLVEDEDKQE